MAKAYGFGCYLFNCSIPTMTENPVADTSFSFFPVHGCAAKPAKEGSNVLTSASTPQRQCGRPVAASELQKQRLFSSLVSQREREGVVDHRDSGIVEQR